MHRRKLLAVSCRGECWTSWTALLAVLLAIVPVGAVHAQVMPGHWERRTSIALAYAQMLGRLPTELELTAWVYYHDVPPGVIDLPHLSRVLLQVLRNSAEERDATSRRALHAAFTQEEATTPALHAALERPAPVSVATAALADEREGGGYDGLLRWLARPSVHAEVVRAAGL